MIPYLWDESASHDTLRALRQLRPKVDAVSIQEVGYDGATDEQVIDFAVKLGRVIVTRDRKTLIAAAKRRSRQGVTVPGVVLTSARQSPGDAAEDLALIAEGLRPEELANEFVFLPL